MQWSFFDQAKMIASLGSWETGLKPFSANQSDTKWRTREINPWGSW